MEAYHNRDKRYVINDTRVVSKEDKTVNRFHQLCIVLFHGILKVSNYKLWKYGLRY